MLGFAGLSSGQETTTVTKKRPVTVADAISMTRIAGSAYPGVNSTSGFAVFSPDGEHFAIVLSQGNMEKNTNDYSLLLFRTYGLSHSDAVPKVLASFSSASNRAGVFDLRWSEDGETLFFLATRGKEATQLYSFRRDSGELKELTHHQTSLKSYGASGRVDILVFAAEKPERDVINDDVLQRGLHIEKEPISGLISGRISGAGQDELFTTMAEGGGEQPLHALGRFEAAINDPLHVSPDGRHLVVKTHDTEVPRNWSEYQDVEIQQIFRRGVHKGSETGILRYELLDTQTGQSEVLLDAPTTYSSSDVLWSPDSKSVLLCGTYLPLDVRDSTELQSRRSSRFVVEIKLPSRAVVKITNEELTPVDWDPRTGTVKFRRSHQRDASADPLELIYYRKMGEAWKRLSAESTAVERSLPDVIAQQDLNLPPQIVAVNAKTKERTKLLDLNPQFAGLAFGKVEEVNWRDGRGNRVTGGLYWPADYIPGKRYPLVIQTHGFPAHKFMIDGAHSTASAAQPLASKGIAVLQMNDIFYDSQETPQEARRAIAAYESAVEYLDKRGIIDRNRVGLIGFSRTCMYVKYALTHSTQHFAAAVVGDGVDAGYFQYLMFYNVDPLLASDFESIIGGPPFGSSLSLWLKNSPGFLLERVQTPLQIQVLGPDSLLGEWQWFEGLKRLGKPVDMVYLPTAAHVLVKPWDRMVSQEGTLDWFCFWLKAEEDPNPEKASQYARWRELRKQRSTPAPRN
jgi:dipeptidyl aminopeptidase/acylaminoacyl peptidase